MAELTTDPLAVGEAALATGDWQAAREAFQAALEQGDTPSARDGLARALWWIEGPAPAVAERTHAYAGYRRVGDDRAAAHIALWIAHEYHYGDRSETIEAGEAYFTPPGHTPELHAGTELVEFSPTADLERTLEVVMRNVEAAQSQA